MDQTTAPTVGDAAWVEKVFGNPAQATPASPAPAQASAPVAPQPTAAAPAATAEETFEQRWERAYGPKKDEAPADAAKPADGDVARPAALPDFIDQAHPDAKAATPIVQELGLGREQTAKLMALHEQMTMAAVDRQSATWASEAARLPAADIADAQAAMRQFATPELKAILNKTGLGNNPHMIRAFAAALRSNPFRR